MKYEAQIGRDIAHAAAEMVRLADQYGDPVETDFNGIRVVVRPGTTVDAIVAEYQAEAERRAAAWRESPEGRESARRGAEAQARAAAAKAEGVLPFALRDPEIWQSWVDANTEPYGACTVRYAARWASMMEARMAAGAALVDIADETSHGADAEGITGFMYGAAVAMLAAAWKHGEDLRRWHNLDVQIGNEGERANETGGTLNPAMLCVGRS